MGLDDDQSRRPKRRARVTEVMQATCGPIYGEIKRAFGLEIISTEIKQFAKEQDIESKVVHLAEHIAYILVNIYSRQSANIAGLTIKTRMDLTRMVQLDEGQEFDDSSLVEPEVDPKMHRLALDFLNR